MRFTETEIRRLPQTFGIRDVFGLWDVPALVVNTGLWACRFTERWVEDVVFSNVDRIIKRDDGTFEPTCVTEDWNFSLWAARRKLRVYACSKLAVTHYGIKGWPSDDAGAWASDYGDECE